MQVLLPLPLAAVWSWLLLRTLLTLPSATGGFAAAAAGLPATLTSATGDFAAVLARLRTARLPLALRSATGGSGVVSLLGLSVRLGGMTSRSCLPGFRRGRWPGAGSTLAG